MKLSGFHRLHALRMENDEIGFTMDEMKPRFESIKNRHENGTAPRSFVVHQLFQTPVEWAETLAELANIKLGSRFLEPQAGLGRLLDAAKHYLPGEVVAVDVAPECCEELFRQDREGVIIKQRDFLTMSPDEIGLFDSIAMNPPFTMRADIRHIEHALQFLAPGGTCAAFCMAGRFREEALKPLASHWIDVPAGAFKSSGTNIPTAICVFKN